MFAKIFCINLFLTSILFCQSTFYSNYTNTSKNNFIDNLKNDINMIYTNNNIFWRDRFNSNGVSFAKAGLIIGATAFSLNFDKNIRRNILSTRSNELNNIMSVGEKMGRAEYYLYLSGALYFTGNVLNNDELRKTSLILTHALAVNGIFTLGLKAIFDRARPYENEGVGDINFMEMEFNQNYSMPSGHSSTAFTVATVLSERIDNIFTSIFLYSCASLTAYQRMYSDVHWFSDTLLGAAIGILVGLEITSLYEDSKTNRLNLELQPCLGSRSTGVNLRLTF